MPPRPKQVSSDRSCILVMGMHRSGTSALAGVLRLLGNDLPSHIGGSDINNQKGYFESIPINFFNDDILAALGSSWDDWRARDAAGDFPGRAALESRARTLLEAEFGTSAQFFFKDPRNCRTGAFWLPLLREQGCRIVALHTLRNPWEVAASLGRRDQMLPEQGLLLWLRHTLDAERLTRDLPRYHTSYDLLMQDWRSLAEKAGLALGLRWKHSPDAVAAEVATFLTQDLRHFELPRPAESAAWTWVRETHDILQNWSLNGEIKADQARLDAINAQLTMVEPGLQAMLDALARREDQLHDTGQKTAALQDHLAKISADLHLHQQQEETRLRQIAELKARQAHLLHAMQQTVQAALAERDQSAQDAAALRSSTSWRLTAPLRRLILLLRRA